MNTATEQTTAAAGTSKTGYNRFLLLVAGLGGLLYGVDVGIIAGALPYLEATSGLNAGQLSFIVAAVLLGSVISTLFAGMLADWMGRKKLMALSGVLFVASIPMIALAHGYGPLVLGRLLQGVSAGLIGVVVPLYLAECLGASNRGKGTGHFPVAADAGHRRRGGHRHVLQHPGRGGRQAGRRGQALRLQGLGVAQHLLGVAAAGHPVRDRQLPGRRVAALALPPGTQRRRAGRLAALAQRRAGRGRTQGDGRDRGRREGRDDDHAARRSGNRCCSRKYVIPFVLACVILACNQATGVNSIIGYNATILIQAGLTDVQAHLGYVILTCVNFLMTMVGVMLVDRKGRKFLLSLGSAGIIVSLVCVGADLPADREAARGLQGRRPGHGHGRAEGQSLISTRTPRTSCWPPPATRARPSAASRRRWSSSIPTAIPWRRRRSCARTTRAAKLEITRESCLPVQQGDRVLLEPFANLDAAKTAPLKIENALITPGAEHAATAG